MKQGSGWLTGALALGIACVVGARAGASGFAVTNGSESARTEQTVEVPWAAVAGVEAGRLAVRDAGGGEPLLTQAFDADGDGSPDRLLFQADFAPGETKRFEAAAAEGEPPASKVYGRAVPERKDDWAWESDRIAYRVYGPALEPANDAGSGIDPWVKSTREPVLNRWYAAGDYHRDHGEGLDGYKVGKSRGAGGMAVFVDGTMYPSGHYASARSLANGPVRVAFELTFAPWETPLGEVSAVQRISLDHGANLSRIETVFSVETAGGEAVTELPVALGLLQRDGEGSAYADARRWMGYWEPESGPNGHTAVGVVVPEGGVRFVDRSQAYAAGVGEKAWTETHRHHLAVTTARVGEPFVYFAGAGWSKSGDFPDAETWFAYLAAVADRATRPVSVEVLER